MWRRNLSGNCKLYLGLVAVNLAFENKEKEIAPHSTIDPMVDHLPLQTESM